MSEDTLSRRSFLKVAGVTLAAAFLESCGLKPVVGSVDASTSPVDKPSSPTPSLSRSTDEAPKETTGSTGQDDIGSDDGSRPKSGETTKTPPPAEERRVEKTSEVLKFPKAEDPLCIRVVDSKNPVTEEFIVSEVAPNLQTIAEISKEIPVLNEATKIHDIALPHLRDMVVDSKNDGASIVVRSAFRSFEEQRIALSKVNGDTTLVALPGTTQHHTGLAVDFTSGEVGNMVGMELNFGSTIAGSWLRENSWRYGFVMPYVNGHDGVAKEDWHYCYIGVELAQTYHDLKVAGWPGDPFDLQKAVATNDTSLLSYLD